MPGSGTRRMIATSFARTVVEQEPNRSCANRSNRRQRFNFNKRLYQVALAHRGCFQQIEGLADVSQPAMTGWHATTSLLSASLPRGYGGSNESEPSITVAFYGAF